MEDIPPLFFQLILPWQVDAAITFYLILQLPSWHSSVDITGVA